MTAMTKEQRKRWRIHAGTGECGVVQVPPADLRALLSDSERLAAIEAVTGEEVRELVPELQRRGDGFCANVKAVMPYAEPNPIEYRAVDSLLSLSAKVAEQAEEIERLNAHLGACQDTKDAYRSRAEAAETAYEDHLTGCAIEREMLENIGLVDNSGEDHAGLWRNQRAEAAEAKRNELEAEITRLHRIIACAPEGAPPPVFRPYTGPTAEQLEAMPSMFDRREPPAPVELVGGDRG